MGSRKTLAKGFRRRSQGRRKGESRARGGKRGARARPKPRARTGPTIPKGWPKLGFRKSG